MGSGWRLSPVRTVWFWTFLCISWKTYLRTQRAAAWWLVNETDADVRVELCALPRGKESRLLSPLPGGKQRDSCLARPPTARAPELQFNLTSVSQSFSGQIISDRSNVMSVFVLLRQHKVSRIRGHTVIPVTVTLPITED